MNAPAPGFVPTLIGNGIGGVRFYTKQKSIMQRWSESIANGPEFTMQVAR